MKRKIIFSLFTLMIMMGLLLSGCGQQEAQDNNAGQPPVQEEKTIKMATTTSTEDSGLLDYLLPEFKKDTGYTVNVIAVGTGQAIEMGEAGDVDFILVHSRAAEDKFVEDGFGVDRRDVMYNDFLIIGSEDDPAGIKGGNDALTALKKIAESKATFISRGDNSGTHKKELSIWKKAEITPEGEWYLEAGQGMGDTYRMADEKKAYTIIDRATFLANQDKYELVPIVEGDEVLFNPYGVIPLNPEKFPHVDYEGATQFAEWITSDKVQAMIGEFGQDKYGQALFVPDAK